MLGLSQAVSVLSLLANQLCCYVAADHTSSPLWQFLTEPPHLGKCWKSTQGVYSRAESIPAPE